MGFETIKITLAQYPTNLQRLYDETLARTLQIYERRDHYNLTNEEQYFLLQVCQLFKTQNRGIE